MSKFTVFVTADTRAVLFDSNMHQLVCRHRPHWGSLQHSPDPLAVFRGGLLLKEDEGREDEGERMGWEGMGGS